MEQLHTIYKPDVKLLTGPNYSDITCQEYSKPDLQEKEWSAFLMNIVIKILGAILCVLPFKYLNDLIMFLYNVYCQRQDHCVREALEDIVKQQGYNLETYEVPTNDDYILVLHRIQGRTTQKSKGLLPVFLQHGLLCSSADFLLKGGMAYTFANNGRDVWIGNFRGNVFSRRYPTHKDNFVEFSVNNKHFWSFSFDEHGDKDLPEMIKFVLKWTNSSKLVYIGHSMGTTALFTMMNLHPEMGARISSAHLLAPVADFSVVRGIPSLFVTMVEYLMYAFEAVGIYTLIFPRLIKGYSFLATCVLYACGYHDISCKTLLQILKFGPSGSSTKLLLHYLQCNKAKLFKPYEDYETNFRHFQDGMTENICLKSKISNSFFKRYRKNSDEGYKSENSLSADDSFCEDYYWDNERGWFSNNDIQKNSTGIEKKDVGSNNNVTYSLNRISIPISIWWGEADWASSKQNISKMVTELPNVVNCWKMNKPTFGHLDFLWGRTESFYQDLNEHLDDTSPCDFEERKRQIDFVHANTEQRSAQDNAVFWYINSMSANLRFSINQTRVYLDKKLSSVNLY